MKELFPEVYNNSNIYIGSLEDILPTLPDKSIDVTFSMAVLEHIHPDIILKVCTELKRITKKYIITCEDETEIPRYGRVFPRNYKLIFEHIVCTQIKHKDKTGIQEESGCLEVERSENNKTLIDRYINTFDYENLVTRVFKII